MDTPHLRRAKARDDSSVTPLANHDRALNTSRSRVHPTCSHAETCFHAVRDLFLTHNTSARGINAVGAIFWQNWYFLEHHAVPYGIKLINELAIRALNGRRSRSRLTFPVHRANIEPQVPVPISWCCSGPFQLKVLPARLQPSLLSIIDDALLWHWESTLNRRDFRRGESADYYTPL